MRRFTRTLLGVSVMAMMPVIAGAAGTYYNGNLYQNPQRYGTNSGGYYNSYGAGRAYGQNQSMMVRNTTTRVTKKSSAKQQKSANNEKQGFKLNAYLSHEFANWDFEMNSAKSELRYDGLAWNVIEGEGIYYFGSSTPMQIKVGARYGVQFGETSMIDDDISKGGYGYQDYDEGRVSGYAMSVGTSKDGSQFGFNAAFGLTDFFTWGRVKVTPSVGYRYFKHELYTKDNSGLTMDVFMGNSSHPYINCISNNGETQCDPFILFQFYDASGKSLGTSVTGRLEAEDGSLTDVIVDSAPSGTAFATVDVGDTYYYHQNGTSHKYETLWQGPYVALDMEYAINDSNFVNAGVEFGLPMYDSKGDQQYRIDWAHPTSVEDKGGFGDAYHLGLNAMWSTAISRTVMFSLGLTYDYYKVSGADATTYLNPSYYQATLDDVTAIVDYYNSLSSLTDEQALSLNYYKTEQASLESYKSGGWKMENKGEIDSIYSAMGIRAGVTIKF